MITLITGLPGNGKTLYALTWLRERAEKEGREVYYSGIADLKLPWIETDPTKWFDLPKGAIIVIDEVQRVMRPRQHGSAVPDFVAKLETHRHLGVDLVLITQHPMLLDSNVRRLVGQHFHVVRKFGTQGATIHEWNSVKDNCDKNRADSTRHDWRYPKDVFALYKSAELHTYKRRIPFRVWLLLGVIVLLPLLVWWFVSRMIPDDVIEPASAPQVQSGTVSGGGGGAAAGKLSPSQYVNQFAPRVAGLAYTAPAYDEVTKPVRAPYPAACIQNATRCQCYTQQGTRLATTADLCRQIAEGGFFVAWADADSQKPGQKGAVVAQATPLGQHGGAGGFNTSRTLPGPEITPVASVGDSMFPSTSGRGHNLPPSPMAGN